MNDIQSTATGEMLERTREVLGLSFSPHKEIDLLPLVAQGIDLEARTKEGEPLVAHLAKNRHVHLLKAVLVKGADPDSRDKDGVPVILTLCKSNEYAAALKALIGAGADIEVRESRKGNTPLIAAAMRDSDSNVDLLLEAGADTSAKNNEGDNALSAAIRWDAGDCLDSLLRRNIDTEETFGPLRDPLTVAAVRGNHGQAVMDLLHLGASLYAENAKGQSVWKIMGSGINEIVTYHEKWQPKLERFQAGDYTPSNLQDFRCLASVMELGDPKHPPSVDARVRMLREIRPDLGLGTVRGQAVHARAAGMEGL